MLHTFLVINCFSFYALHLGYTEQILDGGFDFTFYKFKI